MSNETLKTFPDSYAEALAMLYLQNQDLREKHRQKFILCIKKRTMKSLKTTELKLNLDGSRI